MKTLIVDDVQANCRVLRALISPFATCETATTGREAIARLLTRAYHAALVPRPVNMEFVE